MPNVGFVEPPKTQRRRKSSLDESAVLRIAELMDKPSSLGKWVTDNEKYSEKKRATARSQAYRKAAADALNLDSANIKTRVWEDEDGGFRFALTRTA